MKTEPIKEIPVFINLCATASYHGEKDRPIQFMTTGKLIKSDEEHYVLRYTENQRDEETGESMISDIELKMEKNLVTMNRTGDYANVMVFSRNKLFEGHYRTPFGSMDMSVFTRYLDCNLGETAGSVHLKYQLDLQGDYASTNELKLAYVREGLKI